MAKTRRPHGHGTIQKRGPNTWRLQFRVNGERISETIEARTLSEAKSIASEKRRSHERAAKRRRRGRPAVVRMSTLLEAYREREIPKLSQGSQTSYSVSLTRVESYFVDVLGDPKLDDVSSADVLDFMDWRSRQPAERRKKLNGGTLAVRTVNKDFRVLRRLLRWALAMHYVEASPAAGVGERKADEFNAVILSDDEYHQLLEACTTPMLRMYLLLLAESGVRADSEALHLRWSDVDLSEGFIHVVSGRDGHRTKSGRSRYVPMTTALLEAMREHFATFRFAMYEDVSAEHVFHHTKRGRRHVKGARVQSFKSAVITAAKNAKLPAGWRLHDLRHRRVTTWLAEGKPLALVQKAMGHHSITVTEKYLHLVPHHLKALVQDDRAELRALAH